MLTPKRVLDLYCGAGGAAMGLHQAWPQAEIIGVDISLQPHYPFNHRLQNRIYTRDAFDFMEDNFRFGQGIWRQSKKPAVRWGSIG